MNREVHVLVALVQFHRPTHPLMEALPGGVLVVGGGVRGGQLECALPHAVGELGDIRGRAGKGGRSRPRCGHRGRAKTSEGVGDGVG